jgi:cell division protein FtsQ
MIKYRKPHRMKKRKSIFRNRFFWLGILILIIFGGAFYLICFYSFFQVKEIEISGTSASALATADKQKVLFSEIQKIVEEKINQKVLFFPSRSIFLVNFQEIREEALGSFPQIEEANLERKFPNTILVRVEERKPVAIFCQDANCFSVDKHGIIFEPATTEQSLVMLRKAGEEETNFGKKIIEEEQLSKVLEVEAELKNELKILVEEILIISDERFNVKTSEGWQVYFNFQEDLDWQLTKLKTILGEEIPQERRKDLEYVDVRFGNFAPYKYRD